MFRRLRHLWSAFWTRLEHWRSVRTNERRKKERQAGPKFLLERLEDRSPASDLSGLAATSVVGTLASTAILGRSLEDSSSPADTNSSALLGTPAPFDPFAFSLADLDNNNQHPVTTATEESFQPTTPAPQQSAQTETLEVALDPLRADALFDSEGNLIKPDRSWSDLALGGHSNAGGGGGDSGGGSGTQNGGGGGTDSGTQPATPPALQNDPFADGRFLQQLALTSSAGSAATGTTATSSTSTATNSLNSLTAIAPVVPGTSTPLPGQNGTLPQTGSTDSGSTPGQTTPGQPQPIYQPQQDANYGNIPLSFTQNLGDSPAQVLFSSRGPGASAFLTADGVTLAINRTTPDGQPAADVVRLQFLGANANVQVAGTDPQQTTVNNADGTTQNAFGSVTYQNLYNNIDLVWSPSTVSGQQWEYSFVLHPGADPAQIKMQLTGDGTATSVNPVLQADGSLLLGTANGQISSQVPTLYQDGASGRQTVAGRYQVNADGTVGFAVTGNYDSTRDLVVDPSIIYSSYAGGAGQTSPMALVVNPNTGVATFAGWTTSVAFPPTSGYTSTTMYFQAFVAQVSPTGQTLLWTKFFGTSFTTQVESLALAADGTIVIAGTTSSTSLPTTTGAFQTSAPNSTGDGFVGRLSATGDLLALTYLAGGSNSNAIHSVALDAAGNIYVAGRTASPSMPVVGSPGHSPIQSSRSSAFTDGFIAELKPDLSTQVWDTYFGGGSFGFGMFNQQINAIAVDTSGNIYVGGSSGSSSLPGMTSSPSGSTDGFIAKIDNQGTTVVWARWIGGTGDEEVEGLTLGQDGSVYVSGQTTNSSTFPLVSPAYTTGYDFAAHVSANGQNVLWSTLLANSQQLEWTSIAALAGGGVAVTATTQTMPAPDAVGIWVFNANGTVAWTDTLGGSTGASIPSAVATDLAGNVYVVGETTATDFPVRDAFQASLIGGGMGFAQNGFISKVTALSVASLTTLASDTGVSSTDLITDDNTLTFYGTAPNGATVNVFDAGTLLGTATAVGGNTWSLNLTGTSLLEGRLAIQVQATLSGVAGPLSQVQYVVIDNTAPTVSVTTASTTTTLSPQVRITAADAVGLATTYALDVDLNDDGVFSGAELNYLTGTLTNGTALVNVTPNLTVGSYHLRARVLDVAGNQGTSTSQSLTITSVGSPWTIANTTLQVDPAQGDGLAAIGNLNLTHMLDLDQSPGMDVGGDPMLSYNSSRVSAQPVVQVQLQTDNSAALPATFNAVLTWNGTAQATVSYSTTGIAPGSVLTFAQQVSSAVTTTGRYSWSVTISWAGAGSPVTATGSSFVVAEDSSALGAGWTYGPVDQLVSIAASGGLPAGMLQVFGWHDYYFYTGTSTFTSPAGDDGTLTLLGGGDYQAERADGRIWLFDSTGKLLSFTSADGTSTITYTYASGRLSTVQSPDGGVATFNYDLSNHLASIATPGAHTYAFTVDGSGNLTSIVDPAGTRETLAYDGNHRLTSDQTGTVKTTYAYAYGMLSSSTLGDPSTNNFNPLAGQGLGGTAGVGNLSAGFQDGQGRTTLEQLDSSGRPTSVTDPSGNTTTFGRDGNGRIVTVTDALGRTTTYTLDSAGYTTQTTFPDGSTTSSTYGGTFHDTLTQTNELGNTTTYTDDAFGRQINSQDPLGHVTTTSYNAAGEIATSSDEMGRVTTYAYDADNRLQTVTDPAGGVTTYAYDAAGNQIAVTDPLGHTTSTGYDAENRPVTTTDALGHVSTTVYDAAGNVSETIDARGIATVDTYNSNGWLTQETMAAGTPEAATTLYQYDNAGQLIAQRDSLGAWTTFAYDADGRLLSQTDANGGVQQWVYDAAGELVSQTDALGHTTESTYDLRSRQVTVTDALGNTTTTGYDLAGHVVQSVDATGLISSMGWDVDNRMTVSVEAYGTGLQRTTTYGYDANDNVTSSSNPLGQVTSYGYDVLNRQVTETDAVGTAVQRTTTTAYDAVGNVTATTNALGQVTAFGYDALNRQTTETDASGTGLARTTTMSYDAVGDVLATTDALNHTTSYGYDALGREVTETDAVGTGVQRTTTMQFDAVGNLVAQTDALGHTTVEGYDLLDRQVEQKDALGNVTQMAYDAAGNLIATTDADGNITQAGYDALNRPVTTTDALGHTTTTVYDAVGDMTGMVEANGATTTLAYDVLHRQVATLDALGNTTTTAYDAGDNVVATVDALGHTTSYGYDALNRPITTTDALGHTSSIAYDAADEMVAATDALGHTTTYGYDGLDRQVTTTDALGHTSTTVYDAADNVVAVVDASGHTTSFGYDARNRQVTTTDALGHVSTTAYDAADNVSATTDADNHTTSYGYDADNRNVTVTDALNHVTTMAFDAAGNAIAMTDPLGHTTTTVYDALNRAVAMVDPLGHRTTVTYDAVGNESAQTDADNHTTSFGYDVLHQQITTTDALGHTSTTVYDAAGNAVRTTDALGHTTTLAYDVLNRIVASTDALNETTTVVYDAAGNVLATVDAANQRTTFGYDAANQQITTTDALGHTSTTAYDAVGNVLATTDANNHTTSYGYDAANQNITMTDALGRVTTMAFDAAGNEVATTDALGHTTTTGYDALNRAVALVDPLGHRTTVAYDAAGNEIAQTDADNHTTSFGYDAANRNTTVTDALNHVTTMAYDAAGNVLAETDANGHTTSFGYDAANQNTTVTDALNHVTTMAFDAAGNAIATTDANGHTTTTVFDALNRAVAMVDPLGHRSTVAYDNVGNVSAETDANNHTTSFGYDAIHQQISTTDALNETSTTVYDAVGNIIATVDAAGARTTLGYDADNQQITTTDALGHTTTTAYDNVGNVLATTDANNHTTSYGYDAANQNITVTDALNHVTTMAFDAAGNEVATTDALGHTTTTVYDALNRAVAMVDPLGHRTTVAYDAVGNESAQTDADNHTTSFGYDAANRNTTVTDALNHVTTMAYDAAGNVIATTDAAGHTTSYGYDAANQNTTSTDALGHVTTMAYDAAGNEITTTDALNETTSTVYDALNREVASIDPLGFRSTIVYDTVGNEINTIDPLNRVTTLAYDAVHQLLSSTDPTGATTSFGYDAVGNQTTETNARGFTTTIVFDALNREQVVIDALNGRTTVAYDAVGNVIAQTDANNHTTSFSYDADNRSITTTDALNRTTTAGYDAAGNQTVSIDALGDRTTLTYDARNELIAVKNPNGGVTTTAYDHAGNQIANTDPNGIITTQVYDALNRVAQVIDGNSFTTSYQYDAVGREITQTDADGNTTTFSYDPRGLLVQEIDPLGHSTTYAYNAAGELISTTDRLGRREDDTYDGAGRLLTEKWYAVGGSLLQTQTHTYDAVGNQLTVSDPNGTISDTYDALNRVTHEVGLFGAVLTESYDPVGNRTGLQDNWGGIQTFSYDAANELVSQQSTQSGASPVRVDDTYTARGELATVSRYSSLTTATFDGSTSYSYDADGNVTHLVSKDGSGTTLSELTYAYDLGDRLTVQTQDGATTSYTYDHDNQLLSASSTSYAYDPTGNRDTSGYVVNADNQIESDGTWTYAFDANGNRSSKTNISTGLEWTYQYDNNNQMTQAQELSSAGGTVLLTIGYKYDVYGRRIEEDDTTSGVTTTTRFSYDAGDLIADLDSTNALLTRYFRSAANDNLLARQSPAGVVAWYLTDHEGSVVGLTNGTGTLTDVLVYDAFGNLVSESAPTVSDRNKYTGKEFDSRTGLQWNQYGRRTGRFLDPTISAWTSQDPLRWGAGDVNLMRYVRNGPTNATDPSGQVLLIPSRFSAERARQAVESHLGIKSSEFSLRLVSRDQTRWQYTWGTPAEKYYYVVVDYDALARLGKLNPKAPMGQTDDAVLNAVFQRPYSTKDVWIWDLDAHELDFTSLSAAEKDRLQNALRSATDGMVKRTDAYGNTKVVFRGVSRVQPSASGTAGYYLYKTGSGFVDGTRIGVDTVTLGGLNYIWGGWAHETERLKQEYGATYQLSSGLIAMGSLVLTGTSRAGLAGFSWAGRALGLSGKAAKTVGNLAALGATGYTTAVTGGAIHQTLQMFNEKDARREYDPNSLFWWWGPVGAVTTLVGGPIVSALEKVIPGASVLIASAVSTTAVINGTWEAEKGHNVSGIAEILSGIVGKYAAFVAAIKQFVNCFPADTLVATEQGPKPIQDVRALDKVWAFDHVANAWRLRHVIETYQHEHVGDLVAVTVAGEVIESTEHHPFWVVRGEDLEGRPQPEHVPDNPVGCRVQGRWVDAVDLRVGDILLLRSGEQASITHFDIRQTRELVYNFQVEELRCYAVGNRQILVHNNSGLPYKGKLQLTEAETAFVARVQAANASLAGNPTELTPEQIEGVIIAMRERAAGTRTYLTEEEHDVLARLYAATRNSNQKRPPEFDRLPSGRTRQRVQTNAGQYLKPGLAHPNSNDYDGPVLGYRLVKEGTGDFIWQGETKHAVDGEVVHYGTTSKYAIPEGGNYTQATTDRYSAAYLRDNGLRFEPLMPPMTQEEQLNWQRFMIESFEYLFGRPPQANLNKR